MKKNLHSLIVGALLFAAVPTFAQTRMVGKVINEFGRALPKISLRLSFAGSATSDGNGEFSFVVPRELGPGDPTEIVLTNNDTLAIFEPASGRWNIPKNPLTQPLIFKLLRQGDHRFLSKLEMKDLMNEIIQERTKKETRLQARVTQLEQQLAEAPKDPLAEEAKRLGFSKEDLLAAIEKAKQQLQESEDPYEVGLAKLYDKHFGEAARLIEQAIQRSEKTISEAERERKELPEKYLNLGNARAGVYDLAGAIAAYQKAIELQPANGEAYLLLGLVQYTKGDNQAVVKNWKKALAVFRSQSSGEATANEATALGNLGVVFRVLGQPDSARVYLQAALKIDREIGYRQDEANKLGNLGLVFSDLGQPDSARVYYHAALKINREIGYRQGEADQLGNLGLVFRDLGQPDSARVYLQAGLKIAREIGYRQGEASGLGNLGVVFHDLGQPDSARVYHHAALKIDREIGYRGGEATQLGNLGLVFRALGKPDSARVYHHAALKMDREIGYRQGEANELGNLGLVFSALGQPDSARVYHQAALKIDREIGYRWGEASDLRNLGVVFSHLGELDSARVYHQAALKIDREIGYRWGEASDLGNLSFLFHEQQFKFSEAFAIYQQSLQLDSANTSVQAGFAEMHFTTSRFAECEKRLAVLLANFQTEPFTKTALRAIAVANLLALDKRKQVSTQLDTLQTAIASQPDSFQVGWTFNGTKHFINQNEKLAPHRAWLLQLFQALEIKEGREAILAALRKAQKSFRLQK